MSRESKAQQKSHAESAFPELPTSDEEILEYEKFLKDYMQWIAEPVFLDNLGEFYPEFDWEKDDNGVWFSRTIPNDDPDFAPHVVNIYHWTTEEIEDGEGNVIDTEEEYEAVAETEVHANRVTAGPFYLCIEWEDAYGSFAPWEFDDDDRISYKDYAPWSRLMRGYRRKKWTPNPEYIRVCWKWLDQLGIEIPDPDDYSALRADVEAARQEQDGTR